MNFLDINPMTRKTDPVQLAGHHDDIDHQPRRSTAAYPVESVTPEQLRMAAAVFGLRTDSFAAGKSGTCLDLASKLERFGSFVSDKQADFAAKLVEWSKPRQGAQAAPQAPVAASVVLPQLATLMQRLRKLEIGLLTITRKQGTDLCWIKAEGVEGVIGKIEGGALSLFASCPDRAAVVVALLEIEADPEAAAVLHGRASGRCSVCGADLTNPASIERGLGPICAGKF